MRKEATEAPAASTRIFRLWGPLALNWLMMAVEGPILVSLIGRLPEAAAGLAAFSVAFSVALIVEAPIMMLLSAGAALGSSRPNYERLWRFATSLNLPLSGVMGVLGVPPVFLWVNSHLWQLPEPMALQVAGAIWLLVPWPAAIGYRRLWQGILIRQGRSRAVAWGTVGRLMALVLTATLASQILSWPSVWIAAVSLSAGVTAEMLAIRGWARRPLAQLPPAAEAPLSYKQILAFYSPLLLTSILHVALTPMLTMFMARGVEPLLSLAAYPAVTNTLFLFSCIGVAYQEVVIVLLGTAAGRSLLPFAHALGGISSLGLLLLALPGLREGWLEGVFSLPASVQALAKVGLLLGVPMPAIVTYLAYLKGVFIWRHATRINLLIGLMELGATLTLAGIGLFVLRVPALYGVMGALLLARLATVLFVWPLARKLLPQTAYLCTCE